ncbi:transposase [Nonomuraea muscovyensis]|uniref:transposase n=1 Tax=Nonomuraea muscovyensis TaxID=1124761 RepID=UPI003409037A
MTERKPYPGDLTDAQWALIEPVLTAWKAAHPSVSGHEGNYELREIVNAIRYQGRTGVKWDYLPHDLPPKSVTYYYFSKWRDDGTDKTIHDLLRWHLREKKKRLADPSLVVLDAQSVHVAAGVPASTTGKDAAKRVPGRKRSSGGLEEGSRQGASGTGDPCWACAAPSLMSRDILHSVRRFAAVQAGVSSNSASGWHDPSRRVHRRRARLLPSLRQQGAHARTRHCRGRNRRPSQIAFHPDGATGLPHDMGHGYVVSDVEWIDREGQRHSGGTPPCIKPGTQGQRVELATVRVRSESGGDSTVVAWVECL